MNKFIISGASRAGKTTLAKRIQQEFKTNLIAGDAFMRAMEHTFPETGIVMVGDFEKNIEVHSQFADRLLGFYEYYGHGYVLDSVHLTPENVAEICENNGDISAVFLGYKNVDPQEKLNDIRRFDPTENCWTADRSDADLLDFIKRQIDHSARLCESCATLNVSYVDTGDDFEISLRQAYENITQQSNS